VNFDGCVGPLDTQLVSVETQMAVLCNLQCMSGGHLAYRF